MNIFVIDAYAWVEYFEGTELGAKVCTIVEDEQNKIITNAITIAELASKFKRSRVDFSDARKILHTLSQTQEITADFAYEAGLLHADIKKEHKHMGLADVFVLLTARKLHAKVVTGDQDFKGMKDVLLLHHK